MPEEGKDIMSIPEQEPKMAGGPEKPVKPEIKPIAGGAPWLYAEKSELGQLKSRELRRIVEVLETTPQGLLTEDVLRRRFVQIQDGIIEGKTEPDEAQDYLKKINAKIEELAEKRAEAEPEIVRLERPKNPEEAVTTFLKEVFNLHERGLREGKGWEKTGELYSEYTTLQRWVEDVYPKRREDEFRGVKDETLSAALGRECPEGVFLKEKLTLLLEAMKRLHNRQIEVIRAEGGLVDLGVIKGPEGLAPQLKPPFTNLRPIDWWVLTHIKGLFPESKNNTETVIDVATAWNEWQAIGRRPEYEWVEEKGEVEEKGKREWKTKKIKIGKDELPFRFEDIYKSDVVMKRVREKIAREIGRGVLANGELAPESIRAEKLAHSLLVVSLTLDVWDRERWKIKGKQEARDLMWFEWKRVLRLSHSRPAGPVDTVGCYWFPEKKDKDLEQADKKDKKLLEILRRNKERSVFGSYQQGSPSEGTIIGDFFHSTTFKDKNRRPCRLSDVVSLDEIPWLEPGKFEEETYSGYFGYSMFIAAQIEENIGKLGWKPEDLLNRDFWVRLTDLTIRLENFCPKLVASGSSEESEIMGLRRTLARGIFWTGSYLAQPNPNNPFTVGIFSKDDVYGQSFLGMKRAPGILDAIGATGFLDEENLKILRREIYDFNFHLKGSKGRSH